MRSMVRAGKGLVAGRGGGLDLREKQRGMEAARGRGFEENT